MSRAAMSAKIARGLYFPWARGRMQKFTIAANFRRAQMAQNEKCMHVANACTQYVPMRNKFVHLPAHLRSSAYRPSGRPRNGIKYDAQVALSKHNTRVNRDAGRQFVPEYASAGTISPRTQSRRSIANLVWCEIILVAIKINIHSNISTHTHTHKHIDPFVFIVSPVAVARNKNDRWIEIPTLY